MRAGRDTWRSMRLARSARQCRLCAASFRDLLFGIAVSALYRVDIIHKKAFLQDAPPVTCPNPETFGEPYPELDPITAPPPLVEGCIQLPEIPPR